MTVSGISLTGQQAVISEVPEIKPPPPDISPNLVDPQTLAPAIIIVSTVMMVWAFLFVVVRLYANYHAPRGLGIDDCETHFFYLTDLRD